MEYEGSTPEMHLVGFSLVWFGRYLGDKKVSLGANPDPALLANWMTFIKFINTKLFCKMRLAITHRLCGLL